jgi:ABC-type sulfate transport system permease component
MFWWLVGVAACLLIWGSLWQRNLALAFGVLIGVLLAWLLSYFLEPYVTGMAEIPVWLPALPLATVAVILFVYGAVVWFRGNARLPQKKHDDEH